MYTRVSMATVTPRPQLIAPGCFSRPEHCHAATAVRGRSLSTCRILSIGLLPRGKRLVDYVIRLYVAERLQRLITFAAENCDHWSVGVQRLVVWGPYGITRVSTEQLRLVLYILHSHSACPNTRISTLNFNIFGCSYPNPISLRYFDYDSSSIFISPSASETCSITIKEMSFTKAGNQKGKYPSCWPPIALAQAEKIIVTK